MCDDCLGEDEIIANRLSITIQQTQKMMDKLVNIELITKERSLTSKGCFLLKKGIQLYGYNTTSRGKKVLKNKGVINVNYLL